MTEYKYDILRFQINSTVYFKVQHTPVINGTLGKPMIFPAIFECYDQAKDFIDERILINKPSDFDVYVIPAKQYLKKDQSNDTKP